MSNKVGKVILISGSILAASALIAISIKKVVDSIDSLKVKDNDEGEETKKKTHKCRYITLKPYSPSKDHTISSIKAAMNDKSDIDE